MKTWTKIWLSVLVYLSLAGVASATNPSGYISLHPAYQRAEGEGVENGRFMVCGVNIRYYIQYFRVFVPPGAQKIMLEINDWNGQSVIAHHETPPKSDFGQLPIATSVTLEYLEGADRYFPGYAGTGKVSILEDVFASPYLSAARGGWLYVKVDADRYAGPEKYTNAVSFTVNADAYNDWYDHAGSNPDGSINWEKDVEGVTEYLPPNAKPGKPVVTPASDTVWTTGTKQTITVTSTKADNIYGTVASSGAIQPENPRIPSANDYDIKGDGASLSCDLLGVAGEIRMYKYRFIGVNIIGLSDESDVYSYTIDLRPSTPGAVTVTPPTDTTFKASPSDVIVMSEKATAIYYTQTEDGTTDPPDPSLTSSKESGPKSVIQLKGKPGQKTTFKMKFMGYNEYGAGSSGKISGVYTYVMDLTPPGAVIADPSSGIWTSVQPPVKLICSGADKIYYTVLSSTSGAPADPAEPTDADSVIVLIAGSGTYNIPYGSNVDTQTKVRFKGWNGGGFSPSSLLCTYEINTYTPPPVGDPPGAASANPASGSWTDASQAFTSVSAQGATSILATYTKTTDGSTPGTPPDPNSSNAMLSNSGSTVKFPIPTTSQKLTKVLMKFVGSNQYGLGAVSATCSYTIDLTGQTPPKTPGEVTVSPTSGSWAVGGQKIAVSSVNATQIEYAYNKTTDGTDPVAPSDPSVPITPPNPFNPSPTSNEIRGIISGASGNFDIPSSAGVTTKIKIKFCGKNTAGYGTNTQAYSYTIDLKTPVQLPAAVVVSPTDTIWTTAPQKVSVSSTNAKQINYNYTKTEDGSEPSAPTDPSTVTEVAGQTSGFVTGASGAFDVPYSTDKNTRIKIRFCGKNDAGYGAATSAYSYSINLKPLTPAAVVVSPADTIWTTAPQTISVSSTNAKQINYTYTKTEDGGEPTAPTDPSTATEVAGQTSGSITGESGKFDVPSAPNKNTRIKIRFCGKNDAGYGTATSAYSYGINLIKTYKYGDTITQSDAKANPGLNITSIILTTVGTESILDPIAPFLKIDSTHSYSVADLVTDFLKASLKDPSIQVSPTADGVMTISSPNFGGIVFTVITGSLFTTADSDYVKNTATGNIEICAKNIIITLYPAGADQSMFKKTIESYAGWTVSYGLDHLVLVDVPNISEYMLAFRFQFYADRSDLSGAGESLCVFSGDVYGTVVVTYPDGMKQNLVPYIHDPEAFDAALKKDSTQTCAINSNTGEILIKNAQGGVVWKGMPEYKLYAPWAADLSPVIEIVDDKTLRFITKQGSQLVFQSK